MLKVFVKNYLYLEFGMVANAKSPEILHNWGVVMTNSKAPSNFFFEDELSTVDPETDYLINLEEERQARKIMLIASESICPAPVKEALASVFTNLYAEGYPHMRYIRDERDELLDFDRQLTFQRRYADRRYYKGVDYVNFIEALAQKRCAELFVSKEVSVERIFVNVQPLSGAAANNAVYEAFLEPGDTVMGMALDSGGHLTHGSEANRSGKFYNIIPYTVNLSTGRLDYEAIKILAKEHQPKMIIAGYSAYPWDIDWKKMRDIADSVEGGCILHADIAHTAGLVSACVVSNPVGIADIAAFTTHKTMCGPRGAVIITTDEEKARLIETAVFPGEQGGPHICNIAAKAVCFKIAQTQEFKELSKQIVKNAEHLGKSLEALGLKLAYGGTNTHMVLIDLKGIKSKTGYQMSGEAVSRILDLCGLTCNKNAIVGDENPVHPSAIRLGTTWATQRGMGKKEMEKIAYLVHKVLTNIHPFYYLGGVRETGRGKIDFDLMEEIKAEVAELEKSLARDKVSLSSGYPHYYSIDEMKAKDTPLKAQHELLNGKFEDTSGPVVPIHYGDSESEFLAAKEGAALFDMWDLGILEISGDTDRVMPFLQQTVTKDVGSLPPGMGAWGFFLYKDSKPMGDVHILRMEHDRKERSRCILVTSSASCERIKTWLRALSDGYVLFDDDVFMKVEGPCVVRDLKEVEDKNQMTALALIGPMAKEIMTKLVPEVGSLEPSYFSKGKIDDVDILVSCESHGDFLGYDMFISPSSVQKIWDKILLTGKALGIKAAGLNARQRIQKESGLPNLDEMQKSDGITLYQNHESFFDLNKSYFVGQKQIVKGIQKKDSIKKKYDYVPEEKSLKKSCLNDEHIKLTKKMASFAGWEMPLWYTKTSDEHEAVRETAGLFDVSHMGILEFSGEHATRFLDFVTTNYVPWLRPGQSHYSYILDPGGNVLDDVFIYRLDYEKYMMVVNAVNMDKIKAWLEAVATKQYMIDNNNPEIEIEGSLTIRDLKDESCGPDRKIDLSLQGPNSLKILQECADDSTGLELARLKKLEFIFAKLQGIDVMISRTGYTGEEIGFELYLHPDDAPNIWNLLLEKGEPFGIKPCGLGARDSTRTEAGFPLYGHELAGDHDIDPIEAGYGSFVKFHKPFFIGREGQFSRFLGWNRSIVRYRMESRGIRAIRPGYPVYNLEEKEIGTVTSCVLVEGLQHGLAIIDKKYSEEGGRINISLISPEKAKDVEGKMEKGKDYEVAEILPRFMMEMEPQDTPSKV
ncbi:MAG: glycine cleavage system aminomethyltransferase GcvT [Thermoplasmata archaeon]|nr:MAG: glycine cleavage system aminomethyltransferase GcvT [Thermoplasmata archaeon]